MDERDSDRNRFQKINDMRKTWVEINQFFESSTKHI